MLPIFLPTGKSNYYNILLAMVDSFYGKLPYNLLQLTRISHTVPLYNRLDKNVNAMANWAMDAVIETTMKIPHHMGFQDNHKGWLKYSPHLMLDNNLHVLLKPNTVNWIIKRQRKLALLIMKRWVQQVGQQRTWSIFRCQIDPWNIFLLQSTYFWWITIERNLVDSMIIIKHGTYLVI